MTKLKQAIGLAEHQDIKVQELKVVNGGKQPYFETSLGNTVYRRFEGTVEESDLVWHRDANDRQIKVVEGRGWQLQFDNELPEELVEGKSYFIKAQEYHRLVKGQGKLTLEVIEEE